MKRRSTLIKGRILASVITFALLLIFLIIAAYYGLIGNRENNGESINEDNQVARNIEEMQKIKHFY